MNSLLATFYTSSRVGRFYIMWVAFIMENSSQQLLWVVRVARIYFITPQSFVEVWKQIHQTHFLFLFLSAFSFFSFQFL
jgi:hypothetical protein